ncbi:uncharacterized protein LOC135847394 [Planococcus citri]|uniref:uncharacterized protein LOC135847394 n=1 Tax=Planococcus citri TaxID=170843 RepID=UPI0031F9BE13
MYPCYFTMNLLRFFLASWLIFMIVEEAVSKEAVLHRTRNESPLAVIKKHDTSKLQIAIPHAYESETYLSSYTYDDSVDENGPKEEFMVACPASGGKHLQVENNWKTRTSTTTDKSSLLFLSQYEEGASCSAPRFRPLINKVEEEHCNQLHADMYEVGYSVSNDEEGKDIQFLSTHKICYSNIEGEEATLYSFHRIESPDLLFMDEITELTDIRPLMRKQSYESVLDSSLSTKKSISGGEVYVHKFVGNEDMPNKRWKKTTIFLFNYVAITKNKDLFKGMIRADWYYRLYSYKKNIPLNLYSGTYRKVIQDTPPVDSFWRVIFDDAGNAIILVTQHTQKECGQDYLCEKNLQIKTYEEGGCIYTCSLDANGNLLKELGLPPLNITGDLDFILQSDKHSQITGIIEFLGNKSFKDALSNIDEDILKNATFLGESSGS